jgi:hypothetical protein
MRSVYCVAIAMAMGMSCGAAYADNGTILFTRTLSGSGAEAGSGLFVIQDNGTNFRKLTPLTANSYYLPSGTGDYAANGFYNDNWLTKNFSPDGQSMLYFAGQTSSPAVNALFPGKYYVMNMQTGVSHPLFAGTNDNDAPGYGYLAWGPSGTNEIAFTNSTSEVDTSPPCVELMHTDGTDQHPLWCAPATINIAQGAVPTLAVSQLRWSGNGKTLLAYVSYQAVPLAVPKKRATAATSPGSTGWVALYAINVQTGAAKLVAPDVPDPAFGSISYDGNVVVYQQQDLFYCGDNNLESTGQSLCVQNLTTGVVTSVFPAESGAWDLQGADGEWWGPIWYPQALLSPDGSKVAVTMVNPNSTSLQGDLYIVSTDGNAVTQQLTKRPANAASSQGIAWIPVAWSPDGHQLLANNVTATGVGSQDPAVPSSSEVHIFAVGSDTDWDVTKGYAVDWLKGTCN